MAGLLNNLARVKHNVVPGSHPYNSADDEYAITGLHAAGVQQ